MNRHQIGLVQLTFARASRMGAHLAATFYAELFAIEPTLRTMFKGDMIVQGEKLMNMLSVIVAGLDDPEPMLSTVRAMAIRHVDYGVEARHYAAVGTALIRTLRHELGHEFTPEAREAWSVAYRLLADTMRAAAYPQATAPAA